MDGYVDGFWSKIPCTRLSRQVQDPRGRNIVGYAISNDGSIIAVATYPRDLVSIEKSINSILIDNRHKSSNYHKAVLKRQRMAMELDAVEQSLEETVKLDLKNDTLGKLIDDISFNTSSLNNILNDNNYINDINLPSIIECTIILYDSFYLNPIQEFIYGYKSINNNEMICQFIIDHIEFSLDDSYLILTSILNGIKIYYLGNEYVEFICHFQPQDNIISFKLLKCDLIYNDLINENINTYECKKCFNKLSKQFKSINFECIKYNWSIEAILLNDNYILSKLYFNVYWPFGIINNYHFNKLFNGNVIFLEYFNKSFYNFNDNIIDYIHNNWATEPYKNDYINFLLPNLTQSNEIINQQSKINTTAPPEVQSNSFPTAVEASSNYLSLKSDATPGDRGDGNEEEQEFYPEEQEMSARKNVDNQPLRTGILPGGTKDVNPEEQEGNEDWTSSGIPESDLRELEGEVNREASCNGKDGPHVEPVADLREAEGEVNRRADGRTTSGGTHNRKGCDWTLGRFRGKKGRRLECMVGKESVDDTFSRQLNRNNYSEDDVSSVKLIKIVERMSYVLVLVDCQLILMDVDGNIYCSLEIDDVKDGFNKMKVDLHGKYILVIGSDILYCIELTFNDHSESTSIDGDRTTREIIKHKVGFSIVMIFPLIAGVGRREEYVDGCINGKWLYVSLMSGNSDGLLYIVDINCKKIKRILNMNSYIFPISIEMKSLNDDLLLLPSHKRYLIQITREPLDNMDEYFVRQFTHFPILSTNKEVIQIDDASEDAIGPYGFNNNPNDVNHVQNHLNDVIIFHPSIRIKCKNNKFNITNHLLRHYTHSSKGNINPVQYNNHSYFNNNINPQSKINTTAPPEVSPAVSSSNYLSLKGNTTPGDRGDDGGVEDWTSSGVNPEEQRVLTRKNVDVQPLRTGILPGGTESINPEEQERNEDWTSSGIPESDLRELEGEVNKEAPCNGKDGPQVEAVCKTTSDGEDDISLRVGELSTVQNVDGSIQVDQYRYEKVPLRRRRPNIPYGYDADVFYGVVDVLRGMNTRAKVRLKICTLLREHLVDVKMNKEELDISKFMYMDYILAMVTLGRCNNPCKSIYKMSTNEYLLLQQCIIIRNDHDVHEIKKKEDKLIKDNEIQPTKMKMTIDDDYITTTFNNLEPPKIRKILRDRIYRLRKKLKKIFEYKQLNNIDYKCVVKSNEHTTVDDCKLPVLDNNSDINEIIQIESNINSKIKFYEELIYKTKYNYF